jgi:hypothetical protein
MRMSLSCTPTALRRLRDAEHVSRHDHYHQAAAVEYTRTASAQPAGVAPWRAHPWQIEDAIGEGFRTVEQESPP